MSEFIDYIRELLELVGPIRTRRMFGGHGVYANDVMFAIVFDDALYFKTDARSVSLFEDEGLPPFVYAKGGKVVKMSYYLAPDRIMEDRELAAEWARRAVAAALRSQARKVRRRASGSSGRTRA